MSAHSRIWPLWSTACPGGALCGSRIFCDGRCTAPAGLSIPTSTSQPAGLPVSGVLSTRLGSFQGPLSTVTTQSGIRLLISSALPTKPLRWYLKALIFKSSSITISCTWKSRTPDSVSYLTQQPAAQMFRRLCQAHLLWDTGGRGLHTLWIQGRLRGLLPGVSRAAAPPPPQMDRCRPDRAASGPGLHL